MESNPGCPVHILFIIQTDVPGSSNDGNTLEFVHTGGGGGTLCIVYLGLQVEMLSLPAFGPIFRSVADSFSNQR
jgi:hypothetical protein